MKTNKLIAELKKVSTRLATLKTKRTTIDQEITQLESILNITSTKESTKRTYKKRRKTKAHKTNKTTSKTRKTREGSLASYINKALATKPLSIDDIATTVQKAGYKTKSKSFKTMLSVILAKQYKRVSRGTYSLK